MADARRLSRFQARGGGWVVVQSFLMGAVVVSGVWRHGDWTGLPAMAVGAGLLVAGGLVGIAGVVVLGRNRTPFPKPLTGSELVRRGIYAHVRHPLYTSVLLSSLGWALVWQSGPAIVATLVLIPFFLLKARREERWLRERFPDYADYERSVPRFIPRIRRAPKPV